MRITSALLVIVSCVLASCGEEEAASNAVLLRYKFDGQELKYSNTLETNASNPMGSDMKMSQSSVDGYVLKKGPEGDTFAEVTRGKTKYETTLFDSLKEMGMGAPDTDKIMGAMEGIVFRSYMSERGHIDRVEGMDEALEKMSAVAGDPMTSQILKQSFSDASMSRMMKQTQPVFPEEAVEPGAKWTDDVKIESPMGGEGSIDVGMTMTLRKIETVAGNRVAVIGIDMTMKGDLTMMGMSMKQEGTSKGELRFDVDLGVIRYQHMVMDITTTTDQLPEPMEMKMDMKMELQE